MMIKTFFLLLFFTWLCTNSQKATKTLFKSSTIHTNGFYYQLQNDFYASDGAEYDHAPHINYLFFYEDHSVLTYSYFLSTDSVYRTISDTDVIESLTKHSVFVKNTGEWGTYCVLNDTIKARIYSQDPTVIPKRMPECWSIKLLDDRLQLVERTCIRCEENPSKKKIPYTIKYNPAKEYKFISNTFKPDSMLAWFKKRK